VFFVTYGQTQADFVFQEGISSEGVITWQSQPRQHLEEKRVQRWIQQAEFNDRIFLFARSKKGDPYRYLGQLSYLSHDPYKEYPVWFEFQIEDWNPPTSIAENFQRETTIITDRRSLTPSGGAGAAVSKKTYTRTDFDNHVLATLVANPHLIDAGDGFRWEENFEFDSGEIADLVFFGPGREVKIISVCTQDSDVTYIKAVKAKLWATEMSIERGEVLENEFIQPYVVTTQVNEVTTVFCEQYNVRLLKI
jgi:hypothetical protein